MKKSKGYFLYILIFIIIPIFGCTELKKPMVTYLALGDSYTIGESVSVNERYPVQLSDSLAEYNVTIDNLQIIAKTGWTTDELANGIEAAEIKAPYNLVTLLIGVNNQYRGRDLENYRLEFESLLQKSIEFAGDDPNRVIVISIPDWSVTPFAKGRDTSQIAAEIDLFNNANESVSDEYNVHYAYITDISRMATDDPELIASDGLHPSGKMYAAWQERLIPLALKILDENE